MAISTADIKTLRERTGAGMLDCKKALEETDGNMDKAIELLQKKSMASAVKKKDRVAAEGMVASYIHMGGKIGVLIEVNCESDFVAKTEDFQGLVHDFAMHIAAFSPEYLSQDDVPADIIAHQKEIFSAQVAESGKPANIIEKIVEGRIKKWFGEVCLLNQKFAKDMDKTVEGVLKEAIGRIGENIKIRRYTRYQLGEGIEKRKHDLVAEINELRNA